jgi:DNA replication licensing factor MCM4
MFYGSSSPANGANGPVGVSSPLRQMTDSQATNGNPNGAPSSPLRQQTETQSTNGDRTPRATGLLGGMLSQDTRAIDNSSH